MESISMTTIKRG
jgi:hypothetical protein